MPLCQCQSSRNFNLHFIFHLPQVSKSKLLRRLRVTLLNGIRLRTLWGKCFPGRPFRVVSFDQKPFWFNSVGSEATLSLKGARGVQVVENMCATRERWTFMSTACSWPVTSPPAVACLFKASTGATIKQTLMTQNHVLIQTQEKGSYRVEDVLEFLDFWLPVAEQPEDSLLVMLDWFSAHLHEKLQQLVRKKGHILDYHGGGTTPIEQVNDTHIHAALSREYKVIENADAFRQRSINPKKVPRRNRQIIVDDITQIWNSFDHTKGVMGHVQTGVHRNRVFFHSLRSCSLAMHFHLKCFALRSTPKCSVLLVHVIGLLIAKYSMC